VEFEEGGPSCALPAGYGHGYTGDTGLSSLDEDTKENDDDKSMRKKKQACILRDQRDTIVTIIDADEEEWMIE